MAKRRPTFALFAQFATGRGVSCGALSPSTDDAGIDAARPIAYLRVAASQHQRSGRVGRPEGRRTVERIG